MTTTSQTFIVRDDGGGRNMVLGGGEWSTDAQPTWFGGAVIWPNFAIQDRNVNASIAFSFQGTGVALWGNTPPDTSFQSFEASFDGNPPYATSTNDTSPQTYMQWYQTPSLPEGSHNLTLNGLRGQGIDFILITPGQGTTLTGETLMIDDAHPSFSYHGSGWKDEKGSRFKTEDPAIGVLPFQGGTHRTSTAGDSFSLTFSGTNIRLFGILPSQSGSLSLVYSVDNGTSITGDRSFNGTPNTGDSWNFLFLDSGSLPAGTHTVNVTIKSADMPLILDYALYHPSFATLAEMPVIPQPSQPANEPIPPTTTIDSTASESSSSTPLGAASSPARKLGIVAAGAIGGVVSLCLLTILFCFLRRKYKQRERSDSTSDRWVPIISHPTHISQYKIDAFQSNQQAQWLETDTATLVGAGANPSKVGYGTNKPGHSRKDSATLPPPSPLPQTVSFTVAYAPAAQRRVEIRARIEELQAMVTQLEADEAASSSFASSEIVSAYSSSPYDGDAYMKSLPPLPSNSMQLQELRRDIGALKEEYDRLGQEMRAATPGYGREDV